MKDPITTLDIEAFGRVVFRKATFNSPVFEHEEDAFTGDYACFLHLLSGEVANYTAASTLHLQAKESVIKQCGTYVSRYLASQRDNCEVLIVFFYPEVLLEVFKGEAAEIVRRQHDGQPLKKISSDKYIEKFTESLLFYLENPELADDEVVKLKLKELILLLLRTSESQTLSELLTELFSPQVTEFKTVIENHIFSEISTEELAFLCSVSPSGFQRKFREIYKDTPSNYIRNRRLEKAVNLLLASDLRVTDIAYDCAFQSPASFATIFRKKYGCSPSEFREMKKTRK